MADAVDALQTAQTGADVQLDERKMYVVEWADGAIFGFTVTPVQSDRGTVLCLARRTTSRATAGLQDVMPGDMLISIGDEKVYNLGAGNATKLLRSVQKPVRLTLQLSPYGTAAKDLPDLAPNEYTYLWESGPLGIVLTTDPKSKLPLVKRFTGKADSPALEQDVSIGDELIYVNQTPTSDHSISAIINIIKELPKPITLRFRKPLVDELQTQLPELAEGEYDFLWEYGSLGLVVGTSAKGLPYVRSFTGKGTSKQLAQVQENDEIILVNDRSAEEYGFHETMQYIMNVPKPAVIRFRRPLANRNKAEITPKPAEASSPPTVQMSAMSMTANSSYQQRASSPMLSVGTADSSLAPTPVRRYSTPRSNSVAGDSDTGILGYRNMRSNTSLAMSRHQQLRRGQQPVHAAEDLTLSRTLSAQGYGDSGSHYQSQQQQVNQPQPSPSSYRQEAVQRQESFQQPPPQAQQPVYQQPAPQAQQPVYQQPAPQAQQPVYQQPPPQAQQPVYQQPPFKQSYQHPHAMALGKKDDYFVVDSNAYYQIQWTDGPFGFIVCEAQSEQGSVVLIIKRTGKSTCAGLRRVAVGDILVKIGDKDVRQLGFERSTMHLRNVPKPVMLTFQAID